VNISACPADEVVRRIEAFLFPGVEECEDYHQINKHRQHDKMVVYVGHAQGDHALCCGQDTALATDRLVNLLIQAQQQCHCQASVSSRFFLHILCSSITGFSDTFKSQFACLHTPPTNATAVTVSDKTRSDRNRRGGSCEVFCSLWQNHNAVRSLLPRRDIDGYRLCESILDSYRHVYLFD
jgi:hypothetical protein